MNVAEQVPPHPQEILSYIDRHRANITVAEEADALAGSLREFVRHAAAHVLPRPLVWSWHIEAICDHLQAAYERQLPRLVITINPGALKSTLVTVLAPAWRWTNNPHERIVSASYADSLATRDSRLSRELMQGHWWQSRWGHLWDFSRDENSKINYSNTEHGFRVVTHVGGGTGRRGSILLLDDAHNTQDAQHSTETSLQEARDWFGNTWSSRADASVDDPGVKIVIGQRVHERDVIGFLLDNDPSGDRWTHLCLPTHWSRSHPFVYPDHVVLRDGFAIQGDPRTDEDELLAPAWMDEATYLDVTAEMDARTIAAQYDQLPAPREGAILKRASWRYFHPRLLENDDEGTIAEKLPKFRIIVHSWDTSFKAKTTSDYVAGTVWGVAPPNLYLLRVVHERMGMTATMASMREAREWTLGYWPRAAHYILVEKAANGPEIIEELKREIPGVQAVIVSVDKLLRAEAAAPDLDSGNIFVPGFADADLSGPDPSTPAHVMGLIEECAVFPNGKHDDRVDSFSQAVNWVRLRGATKAQISPPSGRVPPPGMLTGRRFVPGQ